MKKQNLFILFIFSLITSCSAINNDRTIMIPARDGTKLSTLLIFPKTYQEKYPVILIRTPYKKEIFADYYSYLVDYGYILAIQDVRGRFGSEGKFIPFMNEGKDGFDAVEWLASQDWCDGNIGMLGTSYNGWVQYCAAIDKPPHLKTIIPNCAVADLFCETPYRYGIFVPGMLSWSKIIEEEATADLSGRKIQEISNEPWGKLLDMLPVSQLDMKVLSKKLSYYQEWVQHDSDDSFWKQASSLEKMKEIDIPVFIQTGWFDTQLLGGKLAYNELIKSGNKNVKLIIGPWGHTDKESKYYKDKFIGEAADDIHLQEQYVHWFDYWLKGTNNGIMDEPLVQLYALNSDKWYGDNNYPLKNSSNKKLFLNSNNAANLKENGALTFDKNELNPGIDKYLYNPEDVPIYDRKVEENSVSILPSYIQEILTNRDDYLFYKSKLFEKSTTLLGQLTAEIYASSSALDTDWILLLMILDDNDNFIDKISFGVLRAKFRNSLEKPELLKKDEIYQFEIDLNQCGITIEKGQKIGLIITSSFLYPFFAKNLNTGKNSQTETDYKIAEQKIYHTKEHSSYISIPILNEDK